MQQDPKQTGQLITAAGPRRATGISFLGASMDFEVVKKAGLTQSEFAKLCGVSRVTSNLWLNGRMKPHRLLTLAVAKRLDVLQEALTTGDLPLDPNVPRRDRERHLFTVMTNAALRIKQRTDQAQTHTD